MIVKTFQTTNGRKVELEWGDDEMVVWTAGETRMKIGSFVFQHIEGPSGRGGDDYYLVRNMDLEGPNGQKGYINRGIGRAIVRIVGDTLPVVFSSIDGLRRDDGSHLTGMGPGFAHRMVSEGLATMSMAHFDEE